MGEWKGAMEDLGIKIKKDFWKGKRVFITGHTGFKGTWLCLLLRNLEAKVMGYALPPSTQGGVRFFSFTGLSDNDTIFADIRDFSKLQEAFRQAQPEIVFHLAAQPIVSVGYQHPVVTYETNVMGTVHLLECIRLQKQVKSVVNVTTDKVYRNNEWVWGYRETDFLDGRDPYSNSKSCSELVTHSYRDSFFKQNGIAISTTRAGNVIGGGDFSLNRIMPDCIRAAIADKNILVRNPESVRPYQHVLEPLTAYLLIAQEQYGDSNYADNYNIGPDESNCVTTEQLVSIFCRLWGESVTWCKVPSDVPFESRMLRLDCSLFKERFQWHPRWDIETSVEKTIAFAKAWMSDQKTMKCMKQQIEDYLEGVCI